MASAAVRRLAKDLENVERQRNPQMTVRPSSKSFLEWHFVLHHLPADSVYKDGYYHGKLTFPEQYPMAPPALYMLTPNGRLQTNTRLCLSMTDFHPESWNPAWTVESILVGLTSFIVDEGDSQAVGVVHATADTRRHLASSSLEFNRRNLEFQELFPEFASSESSVGPEEVVVQILPVAPQRAINEEAGREPGLASSAARAHATGDPAAPVEEAQAPPTDCTTPLEATLAQQCAGREEIAPAALEEGGAPCGPECWICYQGGGHEPLIQPCACRGSMSGVHGSCVEAWINHHRASAPSGEMPKCGVCHQAYLGTENHPGPVQFAVQLVGDCLRFLLRLVLIFLITYMYLEGVWKPNPHPIWKRLLLIAPASGLLLYLNLLLAFSLPLGRLPPKHCGRCFFTLDSRLLVQVGSLMGGYLAVGGALCGVGLLEVSWFLPFCLLPLMPLCSLACGLHLSELVETLLVLVFSPILLLCVVVQSPARLVDPADALLHLVIAFAIQPVCWFVTSSTPALVLVTAHGSAVLAALVEKIVVKKMRWKDCGAWWGLIFVSALSTYYQVSFYVISPDAGEGDLVVLSTSLLWFLLVTTLALLVNRARGVRQYRGWQNRHGSFQLNRVMPINAACSGDVPSEAVRDPAPAQIV